MASEVRIQAAIRDRLAWNGVFTFAVPNAGKRGAAAVRQAKAEGLVAGAPDLVAIACDGRMGMLEVKAEAGRLSPNQRDFAAICEARGAPYAVVRSQDEAVAALAAWGWPINEAAPEAPASAAGACANHKAEMPAR